MTIDYYIEDEPLGTAGPLRLVRDLGQDTLVMNGDLLTTLDYRELIQTHVESGAWATLAVRRRDVKVDLGVVVSDGDGRLLDYQEKPVIRYEVSMGIYVISRRCLDLIPAERQVRHARPAARDQERGPAGLHVQDRLLLAGHRPVR